MRRKTYKRFLVLPRNFYQIQSSLVCLFGIKSLGAKVFHILGNWRDTWNTNHVSREDSSNEIARLRKHDVSSTFAFWKHIATALSSDIDPSTLRTDFANDSTFIYMPWNIILEVATFWLLLCL